MTTSADTNPVTTGSTPGANPLPTDPLVGKPSAKSESLSNWAGPYVTDMLGKAAAYANTPYEVYGGPLTAGASELQQKYFGGLGGLDFPGQLGKSFTSDTAATLPQYTGLGGPTAPGAAGPTGIASQYMNPYLSAVLSPQLAELQRQAQINQMNTGSKMAMSGAFGGGRQAIMDAETQRNLLTQLNKTIGEGYATAYDKGMNQFNTEVGQAKDLANMMAGAGKEQRAIEQEGITADLNEFLAQRDDPVNKLKFMQSMLQGLPISTVSQQYNQPSGLSDFMGKSSGVLSLLEEWFGGGAKTPKPTPTP